MYNMFLYEINFHSDYIGLQLDTNMKCTLMVINSYLIIMVKKYINKEKTFTNFELQYVGLEVGKHSLSSHL